MNLSGDIQASAPISFVSEVQQMMYALGDCRRPIVASAELIESIVHRTLRTLMEKAQTAAERRGDAQFLPDDLIFLLRKERPFLLRLIRTFKIKDLKSKMLNYAFDAHAFTADAAFAVAADDGALPSASKKSPTPIAARTRATWIQAVFVKFDGPNSDLLELLSDQAEDIVKRERALRAEQQARGMDAGEYMRFTESRQTSFYPKQGRKFADWLFRGDPFALQRPSNLTLEILSFCAHEVVASLVDLVFLLKRETAMVAPELDGTRIRLRETDVINPQCLANSVAAVASALPLSSQQSRQRIAHLLAQKIHSKYLLDHPQSDASLLAAPQTDALQLNAIRPDELREALRRCNVQSPMDSFSAGYALPTDSVKRLPLF